MSTCAQREFVGLPCSQSPHCYHLTSLNKAAGGSVDEASFSPPWT